MLYRLSTAPLAGRAQVGRALRLHDAPQRSITSWATFDTLCQFREYLSTEDPGAPADTRSVDTAPSVTSISACGAT